MENPFPWSKSLVIGLVDWYSWALLAPGIVWLARRHPFGVHGGGRAAGGAAGWLRTVLVHLPAGALFTVMKMLIEYGANQAISYSPQRRLSATYFHTNFLTYLAILGAILALDYYDKYRVHQLRASRLEARLSQAQLQVLRMQLQPHFLFNTLHAVSTLMRRDVPAADRMIARLSDLLRLTLERGERQEVPLRDEMEMIHLYLEILAIRFQDRLRIETDIEPGSLDLLVPSMILQPLVENAVRHGIGSRSEGGLLAIHARTVDGRLRLVVRDDGPGLPATGAADGVGLANTRSRLEALYGSSHTLRMSGGESAGLTVTLEIPARLREVTHGEEEAAR